MAWIDISFVLICPMSSGKIEYFSVNTNVPVGEDVFSCLKRDLNSIPPAILAHLQDRLLYPQRPIIFQLRNDNTQDGEGAEAQDNYEILACTTDDESSAIQFQQVSQGEGVVKFNNENDLQKIENYKANTISLKYGFFTPIISDHYPNNFYAFFASETAGAEYKKGSVEDYPEAGEKAEALQVISPAEGGAEPTPKDDHANAMQMPLSDPLNLTCFLYANYLPDETRRVLELHQLNKRNHNCVVSSTGHVCMEAADLFIISDHRIQLKGSSLSDSDNSTKIIKSTPSMPGFYQCRMAPPVNSRVDLYLFAFFPNATAEITEDQKVPMGGTFVQQMRLAEANVDREHYTGLLPFEVYKRLKPLISMPNEIIIHTSGAVGTPTFDGTFLITVSHHWRPNYPNLPLLMSWARMSLLNSKGKFTIMSFNPYQQCPVLNITYESAGGNHLSRLELEAVARHILRQGVLQIRVWIILLMRAALLAGSVYAIPSLIMYFNTLDIILALMISGNPQLELGDVNITISPGAWMPRMMYQEQRAPWFFASLFAGLLSSVLMRLIACIIEPIRVFYQLDKATKSCNIKQVFLRHYFTAAMVVSMLLFAISMYFRYTGIHKRFDLEVMRPINVLVHDLNGTSVTLSNYTFPDSIEILGSPRVPMYGGILLSLMAAKNVPSLFYNEWHSAAKNLLLTIIFVGITFQGVGFLNTQCNGAPEAIKSLVFQLYDIFSIVNLLGLCLCQFGQVVWPKPAKGQDPTNAETGLDQPLLSAYNTSSYAVVKINRLPMDGEQIESPEIILDGKVTIEREADNILTCTGQLTSTEVSPRLSKWKRFCGSRTHSRNAEAQQPAISANEKAILDLQLSSQQNIRQGA